MIEKQCPQCNKSFYVKPSHFDKRTYCSRACMSQAYKTKLQGEANPNYSSLKDKSCALCGKTFHSYVKTRVYCSQSCAGKAVNNLSKVDINKTRQKRAPSGIKYFCPQCGVSVATRRTKCEDCKMYGKRSIRTCVICGKQFWWKVLKKTCSDACRSKHLSLRQQGDKSHLWQGGKTSASVKVRNSYTYASWRTAVYERDNYTCQLCEQRGGKLAAHHIKPFSTNRHLALQVWNGITLCWACHQSIKGKERKYETLFFVHTDGYSQIAKLTQNSMEEFVL